jgi:hypothetical protein
MSEHRPSRRVCSAKAWPHRALTGRTLEGGRERQEGRRALDLEARERAIFATEEALLVRESEWCEYRFEARSSGGHL